MIHRFLNYEIPVWWLLLVALLVTVLAFGLSLRRACRLKRTCYSLDGGSTWKTVNVPTKTPETPQP